MTDWANVNIQDWSPEQVRSFIQTKCESAPISDAQLEAIQQKVDQDGIDGPTLLNSINELPTLFGEAFQNISAPLQRGFRQEVMHEHQQQQQRQMPGVGGQNFAPQTDYEIIFREGIQPPVPIRVTAQMTLAAVIQLYVDREGGDANFQLHDGHRECNKTKTLQQLGLTQNGCTVNIVGRNNGG